MAWQRFNRSTSIFEVSDDNGATWQPLGNIAYENKSNGFIGNQFITAPAGLITGFVEASSFLRSALGLYDNARGTPIGNWIPFTPSYTVPSGTISLTTNYDHRYMLVGKTMFLSLFARVTLGATPDYIALTLPGGNIAAALTGVPFSFDDSFGLSQAASGSGSLALYRTASGAVWAAGLHLISGIIPIPLL